MVSILESIVTGNAVYLSEREAALTAVEAALLAAGAARSGSRRPAPGQCRPGAVSQSSQSCAYLPVDRAVATRSRESSYTQLGLNAASNGSFGGCRPGVHQVRRAGTGTLSPDGSNGPRSDRAISTPRSVHRVVIAHGPQ